MTTQYSIASSVIVVDLYGIHSLYVVSVVWIAVTPFSVVFIGPGKFQFNNLGQSFRIRKSQVWQFLLWLKNHNCLYADILLNENNH